MFWAFLILGTVYLEAFGILFSRNAEWAIPIVGHWDLLGFAQDFIAVMALVGIATFAAIRLRENPDKLGRKSRFSGSHLGGAWVILGMIFNVIWTMFLFRGASRQATSRSNLPYGDGAFASQAVGKLFGGLTRGRLETLEGVGLLLHIGVMLAFLVIVLNSKHLHIFVAPLNVLFGRRPKALGAVKPLTSEGKPVTLDDIEDMDENATLGVGVDRGVQLEGDARLRDLHRVRPLPVAVPGVEHREAALSEDADHEPARPRVREGAVPPGRRGEPRATLPAGRAGRGRPAAGRRDRGAWRGSPTGGAVIDTDVLWSCVTCGACVEQCPVDIEHVDHIIDMRRYQVLVESNFPAELNQLFKGMENKGNPWNMSPTARHGLGQGPRLRGQGRRRGRRVARRGRLAVLGRLRRRLRGPAEEDHPRGGRAAAHGRASRSRVLGNGETCNGDQARRAGNEFVFQGLAQQNVETFKEYKVKKVVSTCAHCFNTLKNEYKEFGVELEVVHHTQLLNRLVREGKLTPVEPTARARTSGRSPTTTPATSAATTASTPRRASCSRCCPAPSSSRWSATPSGPSAAAPAAPGCGWRRTSASGSTSTAPRRRSAPAPTRSRSAARSAG